MGAGSTVRAAVAGSTGYIGMQCAALLAAHPRVELTHVLGRSHAGERHCDVVPGSEVTLQIEDTLDSDSADVVFAALPHTVAAHHAGRWLAAGATVVDMSADFRLHDAAAYRAWYGVEHPAPDLLGESVYGLVELHRESLRDADLIAAPGCYPTATLLACVPALRAGLVEHDVVVDAKSGVSGAGRSPQLGSSFAEVNESVHAYSVSGHRHKSEMLEQLHDAAGGEVRLTFVPHLVPMTRGILVTAYLRPRHGTGAGDIEAVYRGFCEGNPLLHYSPVPPATKAVSGTNLALLNCAWQDGVAVVTVAIDNLLKGAAGQGVQAFNVRFGFDELTGLTRVAQWP
ncbi:MAG: N-acetyl-gamma-glutamyl-phosphate reductase [Candidatus Dormibacteraeota bacterium]|nr:N-acetyl-gamma-glutamyl-phosphate reductase [Candidatus Dormibacteraeota bacterium]